MTPTAKMCRRCQVTKHIEEFEKPRLNGYVRPDCRACNMVQRAEYDEARRAQIREAGKGTCATCSGVFSVDDLVLGKSSHCRRCYRNRWLMAKYGITIEDYERMFEEQNGLCAICSTCDPGGNGEHFAVDHCHKTDRVRGLLCEPCNRRLLPLVDDDPTILRRAADYLERA